jgi:hypothetical protein
MYRTFAGCPAVVLVFSALSLAGSAKSKLPETAQYVPATVLKIAEREVQSNYVGSSPSDPPLQDEVHIYEVSLRLACGKYVGEFKSPFDYLPAILRANRPVEVRLQKHVMKVRVPGEEEYQMSIVIRPRNAQGCAR